MNVKLEVVLESEKNAKNLPDRHAWEKKYSEWHHKNVDRIKPPVLIESENDRYENGSGRDDMVEEYIREKPCRYTQPFTVWEDGILLDQLFRESGLKKHEYTHGIVRE